MNIKQTILKQSSIIVKFLIISCFISATVGLDDYVNAAYFDEFNPSPYDFNTKNSQIGYDSRGKENPNALQFSGGASVKETPMYDNYGNQLVKNGTPVVTEAERVGYYDGFHNGKIHAGAIASININGKARDCIYLNAVDVKGSGTYSGWVRVDKMKPSSKVWDHSQEINKRREKVRYTKNPKGSSRYERMEVLNKSVPSSMEGGYIIPNRSSNAGKVTYYYIRDGLLNGFINLPETGNKRHGVQCSRVKPGSSFWRDKDVDNYIQNIYKSDSSKIIGTFNWAYGYFVTDEGTKIYCWTNRDCLKPKEDSQNASVVHIIKRNAKGFAINGGSGGKNGQNVNLFNSSSTSQNLQWVEIDRGNGYYSYQKNGTNFCIDGGAKGANKQNVYLWKCSNNNQNQQWRKVATSGGAYKLIKRNASGYALNGGSNGANGQNVNLFNASSSSQNLQWKITPINASAKSNKLETETTITVYPNPVVTKATIQGATGSIVHIYDLKGKLVITKNISNDKEEIDVSSLSKGLYYAKVNGIQNVAAFKIIKQ